MEPDKSILSETIYHIESKPVSWNKAQVWERLQQTDAGRTTHRLWYRVAATVLLLMLSLPAWKSPRVAPEAIRMLSCLEQKISAPAEIVTPSHESRVTAHRHTLPVNTPPVESPIAASMSTTSAKQDSVVLLPTVSSPSVATMAYTDRRDTMEKIEPVVGVVLAPEKPLVMSKSRRRKLLHTLEPFEKSIDVEDANTIVLARTKQ